jgi:S1-C subfamily serine protease
MFVPIDRLSPILADLIADKPLPQPPRPWLGVNTEEVGGRLLVSRVTPESPAEKAGIRRGDIVVGVDGAPAKGLADFYRKVWAKGRAGVTVPVDVLQDNEKRRIDIRSMDRRDHLKLKSTY